MNQPSPESKNFASWHKDHDGNYSRRVCDDYLLGANANREIGATNTLQSAFWSSAEEIRKLRFSPLTAGSVLAFVVNAPDAATATSWLADGGSASTASKRHLISQGDLATYEHKFIAPIVSLYVIDFSGTSSTGLFVTAEK